MYVSIKLLNLHSFLGYRIMRVSSKQAKFENWLKSLSQEVHPYLMLCGKLETPQIYVVLNKENYVFQDPSKALECCYKCLNSLQAFPFICDFVWTFFDIAVYNFSFAKANLWVKKFISNIQKN